MLNVDDQGWMLNGRLSFILQETGSLFVRYVHAWFFIIINQCSYKTTKSYLADKYHCYFKDQKYLEIKEKDNFKRS